MEQSTDNAPVRITKHGRFDGVVVTAIELCGEIRIPLTQVEKALGYAPKKLSNAVRRWQRQGNMRDSHVHLIERAQLAAEIGPQSEDRSGIDFTGRTDLLCLTEAGLYRVLMLSRQSKALEFQDFVEGDILPSVIRTGRYDANVSPADPPAEEPKPPRRGVRQLAGPVDRPVEGRATPELIALRANVAGAVMMARSDDLLAVHELMRAEGYGGGRYWRKEGCTDRQLRAAMKRDIDQLEARQRDQLARWMGVHLGC